MLDGDGDGVPGGDFVRTFSIVPPQADVAVAVAVDHAAPIEGSTIHYTVTLDDSAGPQAAGGMTVTEMLPAGLTLVSAAAGAGTSYDSSTGLWTIASLAKAGTTTLVLTAMVNGNTVGRSITDTAAITAVGEADPNSSNNTASVGILVQPSADLAVNQTLDDLKPIEGEIIHYTITVDDKAGPEAAAGVRVTDLLPTDVTFLSAESSAGKFDAGTGVWTVGNIASGGSETLVIAATVNASTAGQLLTSTASITASDQPDPNPANNSSTLIHHVKAGADVALVMTLDNTSPAPGDLVHFTITVSDTAGPEDANDVTITETLPDGLTLVSDTTTRGQYLPSPDESQLAGGGDPDASGNSPWYLFNLPLGASATLTITASVDDDAAGQTIVNNVFVAQQDEIDPNSANNSSSASLTVLSEQQQPTSLSAVSGSGTYGGKATLTATLTAGESGLAGKSVNFTLNVGSTVTPVGSATTDASGVATLTGVSLGGFSAGVDPGIVVASFALDATDGGSTGAGDLTVTRPTASVELGSLTQVYDGTFESATATTLPAGLAVAITYSQNGIPVARPVDAGAYNVIATLKDSNYTAASASGTLKIAPLSPTFDALSAPTIEFGTTTINLSGHIASGAHPARRRRDHARRRDRDRRDRPVFGHFCGELLDRRAHGFGEPLFDRLRLHSNHGLSRYNRDQEPDGRPGHPHAASHHPGRPRAKTQAEPQEVCRGRRGEFQRCS